MHGNFYCVKFHDFTLTQIFGLVFTFTLTHYHKANFFIPGGISIGKKTITFGQLAIAAMLFAKFHAGTRKSQSEFWPPLFEQPIKFVPSSDMQTFPLMVYPDRIFGMDFDYI